MVFFPYLFYKIESGVNCPVGTRFDNGSKKKRIVRCFGAPLRKFGAIRHFHFFNHIVWHTVDMIPRREADTTIDSISERVSKLTKFKVKEFPFSSDRQRIHRNRIAVCISKKRSWGSNECRNRFHLCLCLTMGFHSNPPTDLI